MRRKVRMSNYKISPELMKEIDVHIETGEWTSLFLFSVLNNDLKGAVHHANDEELKALKPLVSYLYHNVPLECWGSKESVDQWRAYRRYWSIKAKREEESKDE